MGKQLYKIELTGWIAKDDGDSDIVDWSIDAVIDAITNDMVGFEIKTTLIDGSGWTHIPITTTVTTTNSSDTVVIPAVHLPNDTTTTSVEMAMDIELDTKGMSL